MQILNDYVDILLEYLKNCSEENGFPRRSIN